MTGAEGHVTPRLSVRGLASPLAGPFTFDLARGACLAVTGPSGAGKSLCLRLIADLDPGEGEAYLDGRPRSDQSAPAWRRKVVYAPAESGWWDAHVSAHFDRPALAEARRRAAALGLPDALLDGPVARLSTGERQRLALVRALGREPPVLLLDEPTSALDPPGVAAVERLLVEVMAAGTSIVIVTHDGAQASRLGARTIRIEAGRMAEPAA